jgi:hypothetical protein
VLSSQPTNLATYRVLATMCQANSSYKKPHCQRCATKGLRYTSRRRQFPPTPSERLQMARLRLESGHRIVTQGELSSPSPAGGNGRNRRWNMIRACFKSGVTCSSGVKVICKLSNGREWVGLVPQHRGSLSNGPVTSGTNGKSGLMKYVPDSVELPVQNLQRSSCLQIIQWA